MPAGAIKKAHYSSDRGHFCPHRKARSTCCRGRCRGWRTTARDTRGEVRRVHVAALSSHNRAIATRIVEECRRACGGEKDDGAGDGRQRGIGRREGGPAQGRRGEMRNSDSRRTSPCRAMPPLTCTGPCPLRRGSRRWSLATSRTLMPGPDNIRQYARH